MGRPHRNYGRMTPEQQRMAVTLLPYTETQVDKWCYAYPCMIRFKDDLLGCVYEVLCEGVLCYDEMKRAEKSRGSKGLRTFIHQRLLWRLNGYSRILCDKNFNLSLQMASRVEDGTPGSSEGLFLQLKEKKPSRKGLIQFLLQSPLPERQRKTLLWFLEGFTPKEIAIREGLTEQAINLRRRVAIKRLQIEIKKQDLNIEDFMENTWITRKQRYLGGCSSF